MSKTKAKGGLGVLSILGLILITLKLLGTQSLVNVSWWIILMPFYLGPAIVLGLVGVFFFILLIVLLVSLL